MKKNDIIKIKGRVYRVICADEELAVLAPYTRKGDETITNLEKLKAYPNNPKLFDFEMNIIGHHR